MRSAVRGLVDAFEGAARVNDWLRHGQENTEDVEDEFLPQLQGPFGSVSGRHMPPAVWVALPVLGYDPADWGGIREFVGEPVQRWQERGTPFYLVLFRGSIGGHKVRVQDCREVDREAVPTAQGNLAGPSNVQAERSSDDEVPEFPTQRLDEEPAQPLNRRRQAPREGTVHPDPAAGGRDPGSEGMPGNSSSSESDWRADWRDFAGDDSSL